MLSINNRFLVNKIQIAKLTPMFGKNGLDFIGKYRWMK